MVARKCLLIQLPDFCLDGVIKLTPELDKCINVQCDYVERSDRLVDQVRYV
jgi:hypothetical protein